VSNCHGGRYLNYLKYIGEKYYNLDISGRYIYNAFYINKNMEDNLIKEIQEADVVLCQLIKSDISIRPYIHHNTIIQLIKPSCKFILIPYIVNINLYWPQINTKINSSNFDTIDISDDVRESHISNAIDKIKICCEGCDFDLSDVIREKYQTIKYFRNHEDPTGFLFIEGALKILAILGYHENEININDPDISTYVSNDTWSHSIFSVPILPLISKKLGLLFDSDNVMQPLSENSKVVYFTAKEYYDFIETTSYTDFLKIHK